MTLKEIQDQLVVPAHDSATPVKVVEAEFIHHFLKEKGIQSTCEVGLAYARSASHILAAISGTHVAMDPFQAHYGDHGLNNLERLGMRDRLEYHRDFSHNVLPALLKEGRSFEFIFIDGDHKFDGELIDFYYADLLLKDKGYILLHDTWMRSTRLVMNFIESNRPDYNKVSTPLRNFALYQKVGKDNRNGMHFREFYSFKSILSHNLILWMSEGKQTPLKKAFLKLKDLVK